MPRRAHDLEQTQVRAAKRFPRQVTELLRGALVSKASAMVLSGAWMLTQTVYWPGVA